MKHTDIKQNFELPKYYNAETISVLLNAKNSVSNAKDTVAILQIKQHKKTQIQRKTIQDLDSAEERLIHLRDSEVVMFKVKHSNYWQARFRLYTGKWIRFSTRRRNIDDAKQIACEKYDEARYRERLGFTVLVKRFDEMAKCCISEMKRDLAAGTGKKIYTAYIAVIETYLIPFFGQMAFPQFSRQILLSKSEWEKCKCKEPNTQLSSKKRPFAKLSTGATLSSM